LNDRQSHTNLNSATDVFDAWWQKTFAQHTALVAQSSSLMRIYRRVGVASESHANHVH
jgi:hypothetical protein